MSGQWLTFDAVDTWMFRDGRPFNQGDAGASSATSVFPPFPPALAGAVRAMLWRHVLDGHWDKDKLGDGVNWREEGTLGPLSFGPPVVVRNGEPLFPAPLHLVRGKAGGGERLTFLKPRDSGAVCDLGEDIRLPAPDENLEGLETIADEWVTLSGMQKILDGRLPDVAELVAAGDLWRREGRVGIGLDRQRRITDNGELYMATHIRPAANVSLAVEVSGWNEDWPFALNVLGGEHRMAGIQQGSNISLPRAGQVPGGAYVLIAISPVVPDEKGEIAGLPAHVCACTGKPVSIGGWNSKNRTSIPLRQCWPAGSMWFIEKGGTPPDSIGEAADWGFGHVLAGHWPR